MPGIIPHLIGGALLFIVVRYLYRKKLFNGMSLFFQLQFLGLLLFLSLLPDVFLGIYYLTHILPKAVLHSYHDYFHRALSIIVIGGFAIITIFKFPSDRYYFILGLSAIGLHIALDIFIPSYSVLF